MTADLHSLVAPYALDALDADERARFESHLDECTACRAELAGFAATTARLGESEAQAPPAELRERLMSEVATTRQERPTVVAMKQSALRRTLPRLAVAAALLVGAAGIGGYLVERDQSSDLRAERSAMTSIVAASDATTTNEAFEGGGKVRLISSATEDAAVIVASDLPGLEGGKVYQVWVVKDDSPTSEGVFATSGSMIMDGIDDADSVAITVEPKGGSKQPTTQPIVTLPV
jgi:anti-sigma-K factor RskA